MPKIEAVLFDMDGTIRDSRIAINSAVEFALKESGVKLPDASTLSKHVHGLHTVHEMYASDVPYPEFKSFYLKRLNELLDTIVVYEHVPEVLGTLRGQGRKIAMVSSSGFTKEALAADKLEPYFDVVIDGHAVEKHKPAPDPVLLALERLKVPADRAIMVGDLAVDIASGKAAGVLATVGLTYGFGSSEMLQDAGADYVLDSLETLPELILTLERDGVSV